MAQVGSLVVSLTLQSAAFIRDIARASNATAQATRSMQRSLSQMQGGFAAVGRQLQAFVGVAVFTEAIRQVAAYSDAWKVASNQVAAASSLSKLHARSLEDVNLIASKTRTSLAETAELYSKLLRSTNDVAESEFEVARATEIVNKAFKAGGASIQEQVNGIRQLAQSLASGIFQGDELRSIRENAPLLAQAIADEFNTTIGGLKRLGAEGALTADRVFKAILKGSAPIEKAFAATNATIAESFTLINNAIEQYIGQTDKALGVSALVTDGMKLLAENFGKLAKEVLGTRGELDRFIETYKELKGILSGEEVKTNKTEYELLKGELDSFINSVTDAENPLTNFTGRIFGIFHPFNAFLKQLTDGARGAIYLGTKIKDLGDYLNSTLLPVFQELFGITAAEAFWGDIAESAKKAGEEMQNTTTIMKTFIDATQHRGRPNIPAIETFVKPRGGRGFFPGDIAPTPAQVAALVEWRQNISSSTKDIERLQEAALGGQEALDQMSDQIKAENEIIAKGGPQRAQYLEWLAQFAIENGKAQRALDGLITAIEDTKTTERQIQQYKDLSVALNSGAEAFRALETTFKILNKAEEDHIDLTSRVGKEWYAAQVASEQLKETLDRHKEIYDEIAGTLNSTVSSAISSLSSAFADAVVQGESFREMLDALLKDLAKLAVNAAFQLFLKQIIGGIATTSAGGTGLLGMLAGAFSGGAAASPVGSGVAAGAPMTGWDASWIASGPVNYHKGGIVGSFAGVPRFHNGLMPNEFPAVLNKGEGVFTRDQMKALGTGGDVNINIDNRNGSDVQAKGEKDENGDINIEIVVDQIVGRKLLQPGASSNRAMKQGFGAQPVGIRR